MPTLAQQRTRNYILARQQHPAWRLLASPRAPLMLSCLESLFEHQPTGVPIDHAVQAIADTLAAHANVPEYAVHEADILADARRELRDWIRRALVTERDGLVHETDALKTALRFVSQLDGRMMTSTASRLGIVQREIDNLATALDPRPEQRSAHLQRRMAELQQQLDAVQAGKIATLTPEQAVEGIREVFTLAMGLRADFRRVEDSWRAADQQLRQAILSAQHHRGSVVDHLLDGQAQLLNTQEGRVFDNFHQQLEQQGELASMRGRIRDILHHPATAQALDDLQHSAFQNLTISLLAEAQAVHRVRQRSEREVSQFMQTGLAAENQRVGQLLNDILQQALHMDWQRQATRRSPAPLPPQAVALGNLPLVERLRCKTVDDTSAPDPLLLSSPYASLEEVGADFWQALAGLDRHALLQRTLAALQAQGQPLSVAALAQLLPLDEHDLETLALWLTLGDNDAAQPPPCEQLTHAGWRFTLPHVHITAAAVEQALAGD